MIQIKQQKKFIKTFLYEKNIYSSFKKNSSIMRIGKRTYDGQEINHSCIDELEIGELYGKKEGMLCENIEQHIKKDIERYAEKNVKFYIEESFSVEKNIFNNTNKDLRNWNYYKAGFVLENRKIHSVAKPIRVISDYISLVNEVDTLYEISQKNRETMVVSELGNDNIIFFEPRAAAYIVHEIFGHCFEHDYYEMFFCNLFSNTRRLTQTYFEIYEDNKYNGFNIKTYDDEGRKLPDVCSLVAEGLVQGTIDYFKKNDLNGMNQYRMGCTIMKANKIVPQIQLPNEYIHVHNIISGFVDFSSMNVVLIADLAEINKNDEIVYSGPITITSGIKQVFENILWIGDDLNIYQNYCAKGGHIIEVFSGAPTVTIEGFKVVRNW